MNLTLLERGLKPVNGSCPECGCSTTTISLVYEWANIPDYAFGIAAPDSVMRTDQTIVVWNDVPHKYQKKIMEGTMTNEDWDADWSISTERDIEDVVSAMLNTSPVAKPNHVHVFRKEYAHCMLKGCNASNPSVAKMVGN